ncbi:MAG: hypothetical protein WBW69_04195 [Candidatus Korobacteraceae bacterium]
MSTTLQSPAYEAVAQPAVPRSNFYAIGLMSFAALLLELSLTRLFSVVLYYHFAFLAISIALLGLGAGALFAYLRRRWLERWTLSDLGAVLCSANALVIIAVVEVVLHSAISMHPDWANFRRLTVLYFASAIPFFITGLLFSITFARQAARTGQLYSADLVGGSLACLALVPLLNVIGAPNAILAAGLANALAGITWATGRRRALPVFTAAVLLALIVANHRDQLFDIVYAKGYRRPHPLYAKWNALSRVEVDNWDDAKAVVIDADAITFIMNRDAHRLDSDYYRKLMTTAPAIANVLRPHGSFAIIGPGGGIDVLRAVASGSPSVTGIEINPIIVDDIMRQRFADYSHRLYELPEVRVHVNDGRSFIRSSHDLYDVVQMTLVDTWAATAAGAFALSENNLYTVEAFREYFEHLKPNGMVAVTRWEFAEPREALRVVSQAIAALHQLGVQQTADNFIVVSRGKLDVDGQPVAVLAKKSPFTEEEQRAVLQHVRDTSTGDANTDLHVLYLPMTAKDAALTHPVFGKLIESNDPRSFSEHYAFNVAPVDDNNPFFFFTLKLGHGLRNLEHGMDRKMNVGVVVLGLLALISAGAVVIFLLLPIALSPQARSGRSVRVLYFVAIGLGYILAEIAFIQRFVLFLGHPTYALTVVVFLMLLSSGLGSLWSRRWFADPRRLGMALGFIVMVLMIYVFSLPEILSALVGLPFTLKLLISGLLIVPLGTAMGMPFPGGLRALSAQSDEDSESTSSGEGTIEWAWAMNAASSVLGSVLAMVIAIAFGLNVALGCAAAAYLAAVLFVSTFRVKGKCSARLAG